MLISPAFAQAGGGLGGDGGFIMSLLPLVLIFAVFYFLLIRPQQKKMKEHREMLSNIRRNDRIVGNGGLVGTVVRVNENDDTLQVEIASGVRVQMVRSMVAEVRAKGEPVSEKRDKKSKGKASESEKAKDDEPEDDDDREAANDESPKSTG